MEVWEWVPFLRRRKTSIAIVATLTVAVTALVTLFIPPTFESTATLLVQPLALDQPLGFPSAGEAAARNFGELAKSPSVARRAARALGRGELSGELEARVPENSGLLSIIVTAEDPDVAADEANAVAEALIALNAEGLRVAADKAQASIDVQLDRLKKEIEEAEQELADDRSKPDAAAAVAATQDKLDMLNASYQGLLQNSQKLPSSETAISTSLMLADAAVAVPQPVSPRPVLNVLLSAVAGILFGIAFARAREPRAGGPGPGD